MASRNWVYDVFPSFCGEDVRISFLSHFLKELDRKLIIAFKDNEIERSQSLDPKLKEAIRTSRIAVVVFSEIYASSSWCLNELLEIVKCKKDFGQIVIPIFYWLDPSDVRTQTGKFGKAFSKTCQNQTEDKTRLWQQTLTDIANVLGYHSKNWNSEAKMIEDITNDVLKKLLLTTLKGYEDFVGIEKHIVDMSVLLHLESEEVRMVGIWGSSGIGKTTIARALYSRLSHRFQSSVYIDRGFISKNMGIYNCANQDDYNMKLHLQKAFLSEILDKRDIKIDRLGAVEVRLKHQKVLIVIDDLNDQVLLDALVGQTHWFGSGSRIIVITKDKHYLRAHGIDHIYKVGLPSKKLALEMFCQSAFRKKSPPDGLVELASEVSLRAGNLPLGLNVLGSYLRGRDKKDWMDILPSLSNRLNGKIGRTLRVSYEGLNNKKDEAIFRHIACIFNGAEISDIKQLIAYSDSDVNIGLKNLIDKSLIHIKNNCVYMHCLLQEMGMEIVRTQSEEPGEREFLMDSKDICDVLEDNTGTKNVLGISLNTYEIDELHIHEDAFKKMRNLCYLSIHSGEWYKKKQLRWHIQNGFNYLPPTLRLLRLDGYPMRYMPSNFRPVNLVKLQMHESKLEKLWEGTHALRGLKEIDLQRSRNLKEIPDLSMATNLKKLNLYNCSSLVELPSSIQYLNKLKELIMAGCKNLETLPTGINLQSLKRLILTGCSRLKVFPDISTNISDLNLTDTRIEEYPINLWLEKISVLSISKMKNVVLWKRVQQPLTRLIFIMSHSLTKLFLSYIPSLVVLPTYIDRFNKLEYLWITECINLETFPTDINLQYLRDLSLMGCSQLKTFPNISTHISTINLTRTGIEEVPWWIKKFSRLESLQMSKCNHLNYVSLNISKLKRLGEINFSDCDSLIDVIWTDNPNVVAMTNNAYPETCDSIDLDSDHGSEDCEHDNLGNKTYFNQDSDCDDTSSDTDVSQIFEEQYAWFVDNFQMVNLNLINCFNLDQEALLQQKSNILRSIKFSGEEVPSYFTHRTNGISLTNIPLHQTSLSQPFFRFRACVVVDFESEASRRGATFGIQVCCRFVDSLGNHFDSSYQQCEDSSKFSHMVIFDCYFRLNEDNAPLTTLSYDHVDVQFQLNPNYYQCILKGCGIRISEDDVSSDDYGLDNEMDFNDEYLDRDGNYLLNETEYNEECEDLDDTDTGSKTDHSEDYEDCDDSDHGEKYEDCNDGDPW